MNFLTGYKTYIARGAQALLALSGMLTVLLTHSGSLSSETGLTLGGVLLFLAHASSGLGGMAQRLATQTLQDDLAELPADVATIKKLLQEAQALRQPLVVPSVVITPVNNLAPAMPFPDVPTRPSGLMVALVVLSLGSVAMAQPHPVGGILPDATVPAIAGVAMMPVAVLSGPKTADAGEEIILDASASEGSPKVFRFFVEPELKGRKQIVTLSRGKVRLASFPGTYAVRVVVSNDYGIDEHSMTVVVGNGTCPCPSPTPIVPVPIPVPLPVVPVPVPVPVVPVPVPVPGLPVGEFDGLPAAVLALAMAVNSPGRVAEAAKLADAFDAVSAQLSAGTLANPISIVAAVGTAFNGSVPAAWDAGFRTASVARMKALYTGGKLNTPDRWAAMLREVSMGLRAVK